MKLKTVALAVIALVASSQTTAQSAGKVLIVAGSASVERAGRQTPLLAGAAIENGDTLNVDDKSTLQVRFTDESVVALRANSQFKIDNYKFDKNAETDRSVMALLKGGMRTITGLIGKANNSNYRVQTATATIGIRGTHFTLVSCNSDCVRPDGTLETNGTFGSVTDGKISVTNAAGASEFSQQDYFYVPSANLPAIRLLAPPSILADRGAANRGQIATGGNASDGLASNGSSRSSGAGESTSPQLIALSSPGADLNAPLTRFSFLSSPNALLTASALPTSNLPFAVVEIFGSMSPNGISSTNQTAKTVDLSSPNGPKFTDQDLANANVVDVQSAIAAISRFRTVSSSTAAGAFWYYVPPASTDTYGLGTHRAAGDAPVAAMPTSGIAQYNYVGSTTPTDNYKRPGSFLGTNLTMNFGNQTIQSQAATFITFTSNAAMPVTTQYKIPSQTFAMDVGLQTLSGVTCIGCVGTTVGSVNGGFIGAQRQGFAASLLVRNSQLTTVNTANAGGNVSVYAKQ